MATGRLLAERMPSAPTGGAGRPRIRRLLPLVRGRSGAQELDVHVEVTSVGKTRPAFLLRRRSLRWLEALLRVARSGLQMSASHCTQSPPRHVVRSPTGSLRRLRPVPSALKARQSFLIAGGQTKSRVGRRIHASSGMILLRRAVFWSVLESGFPPSGG